MRDCAKGVEISDADLNNTAIVDDFTAALIGIALLGGTSISVTTVQPNGYDVLYFPSALQRLKTLSSTNPTLKPSGFDTYMAKPTHQNVPQLVSTAFSFLEGLMTLSWPYNAPTETVPGNLATPSRPLIVFGAKPDKDPFFLPATGTTPPDSLPWSYILGMLLVFILASCVLTFIIFHIKHNPGGRMRDTAKSLIGTISTA